jgi:pyruvoyl-dependent arginine decarboxylase (PvlArgDC)
MSTPVLYQEPARAALADALFTSALSARCEHTRTEIATAIGYAISTHAGIGGCAAEVAAAYGEHPEMAARRMRWARAVIGRQPY